MWLKYRYGVNISKIFVIPEAVDTNAFHPFVEPLKDVQNLAKYNFISIFKWETRKGWDILLNAYLHWSTYFAENTFVWLGRYLSEFSKDDEVTLHILTHSYHNNVTALEAIHNISKEIGKTEEELPVVNIITDCISPSENCRFITLVWEIFLVPPCRNYTQRWIALLFLQGVRDGEDLISFRFAVTNFRFFQFDGTRNIEAMSMGLPVIATNFSGNTEFMKESNSILIKVEQMEEIEEGAFRGHKWALPSKQHLRESMRYLCIPNHKLPSL